MINRTVLLKTLLIAGTGAVIGILLVPRTAEWTNVYHAWQGAHVREGDLRRFQEGGIAVDPPADVTIVEFCRYNCHFCPRAGADLDSLKVLFPGKLSVRLWFVTDSTEEVFPLAVGANCAAQQGQLRSYHRLAFEMGEANGVMAVNPIHVARAAGMPDLQRFGDCVSDPDLARRLQREADAAKAQLISGTPVLFVGDTRVNGYVGFEALKETVEKTLGSSIPVNR